MGVYESDVFSPELGVLGNTYNYQQIAALVLLPGVRLIAPVYIWALHTLGEEILTQCMMGFPPTGPRT